MLKTVEQNLSQRFAWSYAHMYTCLYSGSGHIPCMGRARAVPAPGAAGGVGGRGDEWLDKKDETFFLKHAVSI